MHKKTIAVIFMSAAALFSAQVMAAGAGNLETSGQISNIGDCDFLTAPVTITLSTGVRAGWDCSDDTNREATFGTCHQAGSLRDRSYTCQADATDPNAVAAGEPSACTSPGQVVTLSGRAAFMGRSVGGVIGAMDLNADTCTGSTIQTRATALQ
ncbi:MAG: hypothetical protein WDA11_12310 [Thiohalomonadaceae bacterium]